MKKLITLLIVLICCVGTVGAQRQNTGSIRVAFTDPTNTWTQSHFYIFVYDSSNNDVSFPGVDVTNNTVTINGATYYYRDFPIDTYGSGFKVIAANDDGNGGSLSQSEDLTWCYDRSSITGDTYYSLKNEWSDGKRKAELKEMYYVADYNNSGKILLANQSGTTYSASFSTADYPKFVVANSYAFKDDGTLDFTQNSSYPANIYRPNYQKVLTFTPLSNNVSDSERAEFYRWHNTGYFDASSLTNVKLNMEFTISDWLPSNCSITPYIEKTIGSTTQYVTLGTPTDWKMEVPTDVTAYYVSGVENNAATMSSEITAGNTLPGNNGYIIKGTNNQTYKFYASNADPVSISTNLLKSTGATDATPDKSGVYILALNDNNEAAFFPYSGSGAIGAFKAYLQTGGGAKSISLNFDETTNINLNVNENLNSAAPMYNIAGQRVANNYKGIVIQNGKKFINK